MLWNFTSTATTISISTTKKTKKKHKKMEWKQPSDGKLVQVHIPSANVEGNIFYRLTGPENGTLIVFINGILEYHYRWDFLVPELEKIGFQVLRYDHFNRGFSGDVDCKFDEAVYCEELEGLLEAIGKNKNPIHVVGHSLGGAIAVSFTSRNPQLVSKLLLMAPAGFFPRPAVLKIIGPLLRTGLRAKLKQGLAKGGEKEYKKDFYNYEIGDGKDMYEYCAIRNRAMNNNRTNHIDAFMNTAVNCKILFDVKKQVEKLSIDRKSNPLPVYLLVASHDITVPTQPTLKNVRKAFGEQEAFKFQYETISETRHCFFLEKRDEVNPKIIDFLK
eukprot:c21947_g1_i2.p1 GENE.c21947_g1_i2~~c21947_g1_i2.p1  ORF type:complete len:330 (-),score=104.61 c21947_g1_i2:50-1039(-)